MKRAASPMCPTCVRPIGRLAARWLAAGLGVSVDVELVRCHLVRVEKAG